MANFNINKIILAGRVCSEPELKQTSGGIPVTTFSVAVNRRYTKASGEERKTDFIRCRAWRERAEFFCRYFRKGSSVCVGGTLQIVDYTTQSGEKRSLAEVVCDDIYFVDSVNEAPPAAAPSASEGQPAYNPYAPGANDAGMAAVAPDEDLPF